MSKIYKYQITRYELVLAGGKSRPSLQGLPAAIGLYDSAGQIAQLLFFTDEDSMPTNDSTPDDGDLLNRFVKSHFRMTDYENVYRLLSGADPIYCGHTRSPPQVWLTNDPNHASRLP